MIVCSCNALSDHDIRARLGAAEERPSPGAVFRSMGCEAKCGRCARNIATVVDRHISSMSDGRGDRCRADSGAGE